MIVIACPGQGSQTPGFLNEWLELPGAREFLESASEAAKVDLIRHGTVSEADTIRATEIAQPLIVAASVLAGDTLSKMVDITESGLAGHSVGEFAAAVGAGVLTPTDALSLVGVRGRAMAEAASAAKTGMSAVLGGDEAEVLAAIAAAGLSPANRNGAGQIVAAGSLTGLASLAEQPPRGARIIPLQVAGAFHTEYMQSAISALADAAQQISIAEPKRTLWSNADGSVVASGAAFMDSLVAQIARPVRWDACLRSMQDAGVTAFIELTPAGALAGIAKRALRGVPTVAVKTPADLDTAADLIRSLA